MELNIRRVLLLLGGHRHALRVRLGLVGRQQPSGLPQVEQLGPLEVRVVLARDDPAGHVQVVVRGVAAHGKREPDGREVVGGLVEGAVVDHATTLGNTEKRRERGGGRETERKGVLIIFHIYKKSLLNSISIYLLSIYLLYLFSSLLLSFINHADIII